MNTTALKRHLTTALGRYLLNPLLRPIAGRLPVGPALLETIGRTSGEPRQTPVGDGLVGDTFWVIAEHGRHSGWVRNIMADPRVRVRTGGRWRSGRADPMPEDDPIARQRTLDPINAGVVRLVGTELLTLRIDLEPDGP